MGQRGPWTAYQLDTAVVTLGQIIEGALQEMHNAGTEKEPQWEPRYTLGQLLDPAFRIPTAKAAQADAATALRGLAGKGVKVYRPEG